MSLVWGDKKYELTVGIAGSGNVDIPKEANEDAIIEFRDRKGGLKKKALKEIIKVEL